MTFVVRMGSVFQIAKCVMDEETALMGLMNKSLAVSSALLAFKKVFLKWAGFVIVMFWLSLVSSRWLQH